MEQFPEPEQEMARAWRLLWDEGDGTGPGDWLLILPGYADGIVAPVYASGLIDVQQWSDAEPVEPEHVAAWIDLALQRGERVPVVLTPPDQGGYMGALVSEERRSADPYSAHEWAEAERSLSLAAETYRAAADAFAWRIAVQYDGEETPVPSFLALWTDADGAPALYLSDLDEADDLPELAPVDRADVVGMVAEALSRGVRAACMVIRFGEAAHLQPRRDDPHSEEAWGKAAEALEEIARAAA